MMRKAGLLALLGVVVVLSGCLAGSLRPLYSGEDDVVFDAVLVGKWQETDETYPSVWTFAEGENKAYVLTEEWKTGDGKVERSVRQAHLVSLGMYTFLDTYPLPTEADKEAIERYDYMGLHYQYLVKREGEVLKLLRLDEDWLTDQVLEGEMRPRIAALESPSSVGPSFVMIGTTRELQRFFTYAATDPDAFMELVVLKRVKQPKAGATPPK